VKPSEMLFIDDSPDVVQAAQAAGVTAIQYISNEDLFSQIRVILPIQMQLERVVL